MPDSPTPLLSAAERVARFLDGRARSRGMDADLIAGFGTTDGVAELRVSDLRILVDLADGLRGPLGAYDTAAEAWRQANDEQNDAPDVRAATRYSEALEAIAHDVAAIARPALEVDR